MQANPQTLCLVDVVQQFVALLRLAHEKLVVNEKDVGQTLHLVNVVKDFSHLRGPFATLDVR